VSDPSVVPSALGIEAVEWIAEGGENLTVRVTGRWRRRRPAWSGQPTLIVESTGRRYRFPAMPEPPSLSGAGPGMWRMSFSVPAALAPELGGRSWLQFGSVAVPLPSAVEPPGAFASGVDPDSDDDRQRAGAPGFDDPGPESDPGLTAAPGRPEPMPTVRSSRSEPMPTMPPSRSEPTPPVPPSRSEPPRDDPVRRAEEAEAAVTALTSVVRDLESDLATARTRADALAAELGVQETDRRAAQQREHAERALRLDLARQLAARSRESDRARQAYGELAEAEARVRELEAELETARRRIDEAEQAAAAAAARRRAETAAAAGRERAQRETANAAQRRSDAEIARLSFEASLGDRRADAPDRVPDEPALPTVRDLSAAPAAGSAPDAAPVAPPAREGPGADALVAALRGEFELRAGAEAGLRARVVDAEARLAAREHLGRQVGKALIALRRELDELRMALGAEREARLAAERRTEELERLLGTSRARSRDALTAIGELRGALASLTPPPAPEATSRASEVEPERLNEALARLREHAVPLEDAPGEPEAAAAKPAPPASPTPAVELARPSETVRPAETAALPVGETERPSGDSTRAWLVPIFAQLVLSEPARAGRLLIELLPAQGAVIAKPVSYDLLLSGRLNAVRVTAADGPPLIETGEPRNRADVDFQVTGDHAALARMIVAGWRQRRFGRGVARVRGRRSKVAALESLVGARLDLVELHRLGVRFQARTALGIVAGLIDPALTANERFSLAYTADGGEPVYLTIQGGEPPAVTAQRPAGGIALSVAGPAGTLERVLSGERPDGATVIGDEWPLAQLRKWVKTAQSG